jgi:hypothetical protein
LAKAAEPPRLTEPSGEEKKDATLTFWSTSALAFSWRARMSHVRAIHTPVERSAPLDMTLLSRASMRPGGGTQLLWLLRRFARTSTRESSDLWYMLLGIVVTALVSHAVWSPADRDALATMMQIGAFVFATLFISAVLPHASVTTWLAYKSMYEDEQGHDAYHWAIYFAAHSLYSSLVIMCMCALYALLTSSVFLGTTSFTGMLLFFAFVTAHACAHSALLECIVFVTGHNVLSHVLGMLVACASFLTSGFVVPHSQMTPFIALVSKLSYTQMAFTGIMNMAFPRTDLLKQLYGLPARSLGTSLCQLLLAAIACRLAFAVVLIVRHRGQRTASRS